MEKKFWVWNNTVVEAVTITTLLFERLYYTIATVEDHTFSALLLHQPCLSRSRIGRSSRMASLLSPKP